MVKKMTQIFFSWIHQYRNPQNPKTPKHSILKPQNKTLNQQKTSKHKSKNLKTQISISPKPQYPPKIPKT